MIFKKPNISDRINSLEFSQQLLDERLKKKQIDSKVYTKESLKIRDELERLKMDKLKKEL